ncbi:Cystatin domain-containing protein [Vibrio sp. ES.051]|uniref:cystatin domain-containing protein n=1 Tax=Vibrio sp. ES.051 TaxID=1761909 RepID=UPI000BF812A0|nr:cystatin domain-containing protein [Vibrio sp. ES.051]PFG58276.1 Cystatin domain-containing protein [Vibrio sp. ES.051]
MHLKTVSVCALLVLLAGCQQETPNDSTQSKTSVAVCTTQDNIPGGWNEFHVTPDAEKAMDFVLKKMNSLASFQQILNVYAQIVSGVNYAIEFELDDGSVWNTVVYRNLDGDYAITQSPKKGLFCEQ